ncbi:MAG TPA: LLM class flavin-dependent oxidoreductase [Candidatus Limnocylindria bacterium]|nr:LLM class flavin-dependent oxidoreductase [Candidatus Limnocylindria bacterium]
MRLSALISPPAGWSYDEVVAHARAAEAAGFAAYWVADHFYGGEGEPDRDCLEAWTLLAALARDTTRVRLGTLVTAHSYRNPALLAKIAATVQELSGGRLELGIGAGWKANEYRAYGYEFPPPGVRVAQLAETLEICTRLWTEERVTFEGRHYRVRDAVASPKPAPRPPVWVGGAKPRIMRVAARYADGFNIGRIGDPPRPPDALALAGLIAELGRAAAEAGRERPLRLSHWASFELEDRSASARLVEHAKRLAGSGVEELQLHFPRGREREMAERAGLEVIPLLS